MYYQITIKSDSIVRCKKLLLDEYFPNDSWVDGLFHRYGVPYLICEEIDCNSIWTGEVHIDNIKHCRISFADIVKIEKRSNLYESNEEWKLITEAGKKWSYEDTNRMLKEMIIKTGLSEIE